MFSCHSRTSIYVRMSMLLLKVDIIVSLASLVSTSLADTLTNSSVHTKIERNIVTAHELKHHWCGASNNTHLINAIICFSLRSIEFYKYEYGDSSRWKELCCVSGCSCSLHCVRYIREFVIRWRLLYCSISIKTSIKLILYNHLCFQVQSSGSGRIYTSCTIRLSFIRDTWTCFENVKPLINKYGS